MKFFSFILIGLTFSVLPACGIIGDKSSKDGLLEEGEPLGAPKVKPPVERNTPTGFLSLYLEEGEETTASERLINAVQRYLAPTENDAVGAIERLGFIDSRLGELDERAQERKKLCLEETPKVHSYPTALPDSKGFKLSLQCQENLDGGNGSSKTAQLAFGLTKESLFLFERTGNVGNAVLASAKLDETRTEYWQLGSSTSNGQNYIHLAAGDDFGMEMTSAGTVAVTALDCGLHMKANDTHVYIEGYDTVNSSCSEEKLTLCISATNFTEKDLTECTSAQLNTFTLTTLTTALVAGNSAKNIIETPITGYIDFTKSEAVEDPDTGEEGEEN